MENFNFSEYLKEKGFAFTNYGDHNLFEYEENDINYAVNIQGDKFVDYSSKGLTEVSMDTKVFKNLKDADKWLKTFIVKDKILETDKDKEIFVEAVLNPPLANDKLKKAQSKIKK